MKRIEICGGIASGKTTFATLMDRSILRVIREHFKKNPFWKAFYTNPGKYIFETEITFMLLHYNQIKRQMERSNKIAVCDFSFFLDLAYARIGLNASRLEAFEIVCSEVYKEIGPPSLLVHLKCDANTELARIKRRKRPEESLIDLDFLDRLNKAVEKEVSMLQRNCPIAIIDSSVKNFADDEPTKEEMRALIKGYIRKITDI